MIADDDEQIARFKQKFAHLSEFYDLLDAIRGLNNTFSLQWKCLSCDSEKIIKSDSSSPCSNLKRHISKCHPENLNSFLMLRESHKTLDKTSTLKIFK